MVAAYKPDVSITLAWGLELNNNFREEWANKFHDPRASSHYVDIFFNNALVHREIYVIVDGGRAKLPLPNLKDGELQVPRGYHDLVKLLDKIDTYHSQYDGYFERANLKKIEIDWP